MKRSDLKLDTWYMYSTTPKDSWTVRKVKLLSTEKYSKEDSSSWTKGCFRRRTENACPHFIVNGSCYSPGKGSYVYVNMTRPDGVVDPTQEMVLTRGIRMEWDTYLGAMEMKRRQEAQEASTEINRLKHYHSLLNELVEPLKDVSEAFFNHTGYDMDLIRHVEDAINSSQDVMTSRSRRYSLKRVRSLQITTEELLVILKLAKQGLSEGMDDPEKYYL